MKNASKAMILATTLLSTTSPRRQARHVRDNRNQPHPGSDLHANPGGAERLAATSFTEGDPASDSLGMLAEGGDTDP